MITRATPPVCPRGSARGGVSRDLAVSPGGGVSELEVPDGFLPTTPQKLGRRWGSFGEITVPAEKPKAS